MTSSIQGLAVCMPSRPKRSATCVYVAEVTEVETCTTAIQLSSFLDTCCALHDLVNLTRHISVSAWAVPAAQTAGAPSAERAQHEVPVRPTRERCSDVQHGSVAEAEEAQNKSVVLATSPWRPWCCNLH